ncbi:hypothetical protein R50073_35940 [Maricurvus nonylphenolicus]|uniref:vWA domain-containing protein n=1 Tax=Maricurvus nonylphenolicus TaxID=1008307 RepID=UPI0036F2E7B1
MVRHNLFQRYRQQGAVFVLSALSMLTLILCVGLAVDSGVAYGVRAKLNAATDAAAIAAGRAIAFGEDEARQTAEKFFYANYPDGYLGSTPNFDPDTDITIDTLADGSIQVNISASADVPTYFMHLADIDGLEVGALTQVTRRDLDMVLVLDTSGSLNSPAGTPTKLRDASVNFINKFVDAAGGDRVGLVVYASGAIIEEPIDKTATRGFDKAQVTSDINGLTFSGITASGEALRRAYDELNAIPEALRSSLRVIVFFSDGAPNTVAAQFATGGGSITGDLFSETSAGGPPNRLWRNDLRNTFLGTAGINILPSQGLGGVDTDSYNNSRTLTPPAGSANSNTRCNINKAGRNMVENMANTVRDDDIRVYTLGLGAQLQALEVGFCGYGSEEEGENILKRLANTTDSDSYDSDQFPGLYVFAENADELDEAFNTIASEILRLTK